MSELTIVRLGHPALRTRSVRVTKKELALKRFQKFLDELAEVCVENDGAGIAAPQVAVNKRVIVVHVDSNNPRYPSRRPFPLTIVVNPKIESRSKNIKEDWEGDLSCGLRALVPRADACVVSGLDRYGNRVEYRLDDDFHARVFQHEIDHLNGVFLLDKVKRKNSMSELAEWEKYLKPQNSKQK